MKKVFLIFLMMFVFTLAFTLDYTIELIDSYGDGWNGGAMDVLVNGTIVLEGITVASGAGPEISGFTVVGGDAITTDYTAGSWSSENEYQIKDEAGIVVAESGQGGVTPENVAYAVPQAGEPEDPTNPSPADGAEDVALSGSVTWDFGANTDTYDLWFGEAGNMFEVVTAGTAEASGSYRLPPLEAATPYEWQIVMHNASRLDATGPVWSFTTSLGADIVQIGAGTETGKHLPIDAYFSYSYSQSIFLGSDFTGMAADRRIEKIWYNYSGTFASANSDDWVIYMATTDATNLDAGWYDYANLTQVFDGNVDLVSVSGTGWLEITLDIPFIFDPTTSNLVVAVDENTGGWGADADEFLCDQDVRANVSRYYYNDNTNPDPASPPTAMGTVGYYPNMRFEFQNLPTTAIFTPNPVAHDFGTVNFGSDSSQTFTVTNTGVATGSILSVEITDDANGEFVISNLATLPLEVVVDANTTFDVTYTPTTAGAVTANLVITDDVTGRLVNIVPLSGSGNDLPIFSVTPSSKAFGMVNVSYSSQAELFTIKNIGGGDMEIVSTTLGGDDAANFVLTDGNSYPYFLAAGDSITFEAEFIPLAVGATTATITIVDNIVARESHEVVLTGTGYGLNAPTNLATVNGDGQVDLTWNIPVMGELKHDDNSVEANYWFGAPTSINHLFASRYFVPITGTLDEIAVLTLTGDGTEGFENVMICPEIAGIPDLANPYATFTGAEIQNIPTSHTWLNLTPASTLNFTAGDIFYIVVQWADGNANGPYVATDTNNIGNTYITSDGGANWSDGLPGECFMRGYMSPVSRSYGNLATIGLSTPSQSPVLSVLDKNEKMHLTSYDVQALTRNNDSRETFMSYTVKRGVATGVYDDGTFTGIAGEVYNDNTVINDTDYFYVVTAVYNEGESVDSNEVTAMPSGNPPMEVAYTAPDSASVEQLALQTFTWEAEATATGYKLQYGVATGVYDTVIDCGDVTSYTLTTALAYSTEYFWQVIPYNANGDATVVGEWNFTTFDGVPTNPTPADDATAVANNVMLNWNDVNGAVSYLITIGTATGANDVVRDLACANSEYTHSSVWDYDAEYFWTVTTVDAAGRTSRVTRDRNVTGTEWSFTVRDDPTIYALPWTETFESYPPTNWTESKGELTASTTFTGTSSYWTPDGFANNGTTGAAKINIWSTGKYEWMFTPPIDLGTSRHNYNLFFDMALTDYGNGNVPDDQSGIDDKVAVVISTDGGLTWSDANALQVWDNTTTPSFYDISNTGDAVMYDLSSYSGVVQFGFYAETTVSNGDNDFFIDNVQVREIQTANDIIAYSFAEQSGPAIIGTGTIDIEVGMGTDVTALVATFELSDGATATVATVNQESGITENDFTNSVTYVVEAEDGTTQNWVVTVTAATTQSSENDIVAYSFADQTGAATIGTGTVEIEVAWDADVTNLVATFTLSDLATAYIEDGTSRNGLSNRLSVTSKNRVENVQESGVTANNFTSPVTYIVYAEDGIIQNWVVTVTVADAPQGLTCANPYVYGNINDPAVTETVDIGNYNWFTVVLDVEYINVSINTCGGAGGDTRLWIYDACDGNQLGYNDDGCGALSDIALSSLSAGTYYVRVDEYGQNSVLEYVLEITGDLAFVPTAPQNVVISQTGGVVTLGWDVVTDASGYYIYAGTTPDVDITPGTHIGHVATNEFIHEPTETKLFYKVTSSDVAPVSARSGRRH